MPPTMTKTTTTSVRPAPSLREAELKAVHAELRRGNADFLKAHPGDSGERQPVHVLYGGAHLFKRDSAAKIGGLALKSLEEYAPTPESLAQALGLPGGAFAQKLHARVVEKLKREAVEDFRIDFEDGYGNRPDAEEDGHAASAAAEAAEGLAAKTLPPFLGIRIKPLSEPCRRRSLRTLDIFLTTLVSTASRRLPPHFVITLPKITSARQPSALAKALGMLEKKLRLPQGTLKIEFMVETPQSIFADDGRAALPELLKAAQGRCVSAHLGTYDYTALCGIIAAHQSMAHPCCDFAKHVMQVALAQRGIQLSDGATNVMPVPVHRPSPGTTLSEAQKRENAQAVHRAWKLAYDHTRHSLVTGFYEGWDLHPAQIPIRYAAVYAFFLESLESSASRLKNFVEKAAQATLLGDVFDDAATGQGLLNFFLRGLNCGAITLEEALATGLSQEEFESRSFLKILENRRKLG